MRRVLSCILVFLTLFACASKEERRDEFFRNGTTAFGMFNPELTDTFIRIRK